MIGGVKMFGLTLYSLDVGSRAFSTAEGAIGRVDDDDLSEVLCGNTTKLPSAAIVATTLLRTAKLLKWKPDTSRELVKFFEGSSAYQCCKSSRVGVGTASGVRARFPPGKS